MKQKVEEEVGHDASLRVVDQQPFSNPTNRGSLKRANFCFQGPKTSRRRGLQHVDTWEDRRQLDRNVPTI